MTDAESNEILFAPTVGAFTGSFNGAKVRTNFHSMDRNGDGVLDLEELTCGLSDFGLTDAAIEDIFFKLDIDKDGQVSNSGQLLPNNFARLGV